MKTYDPAKVLFSFGGQLITGYAPDTFLRVERNEDGFSLVVGPGGEGARAKNNNKSGTITLTLMATSQANDLLSAIAAADDLAGTGAAPAFLKELNGTTLASAQNAWVKKLPTIERGAEVSTVEWVIECEALEMYLGGIV